MKDPGGARLVIEILVKILAPLMVNPNAPDQDGCTPIYWAAYEGQGHVDVIKFLAPLTENPNVPDNDGRTPIDWATRYGHQDVVDELNRYVHASEMKGENIHFWTHCNIL